MSDFMQQLIGNKVPDNKVKLFTCSHIIPDENLLTLILDRGPTNVEFEFSWENRLQPSMVFLIAPKPTDPFQKLRIIILISIREYYLDLTRKLFFF
jgi:hypothetical protein